MIAARRPQILPFLTCLFVLSQASAEAAARGLGLHEHPRAGGLQDRSFGSRQDARPPAVYVVVETTQLADAATAERVAADLGRSAAPFDGRILAGPGHRETLAGPAGGALAVLAFGSRDKIAAWTASDALHRIQESPAPVLSFVLFPAQAQTSLSIGGRQGSGRVVYDQKAFEPLVKKNDALLDRLKGICSNC